MNFAAVLERVGTVLDDAGRRYAVIGGVALAALGNPRLTIDLDLVTEREAQGGW